MSKCPGYLSIRINDREDLEELFHREALIRCPSSFNMTFHIPNWGQLKDKTFDMIIEDSVKVYEVFLTQLQANKVQRLDRSVAAGRATAPENSRDTPEDEEEHLSILTLAQIIGVAVVILVLLNKVYIYSEVRRLKVIRSHAFAYKTKVIHSNSSGAATLVKRPTGSSTLSKGQICFLVVYVFLRIVYSLLFTFTVLLGLLSVVLELHAPPPVLDPEETAWSQPAVNRSWRSAEKLEAYWKQEVLREAEQVVNMQSSCSFYITEMLDSMAVQVGNISANYHQLPMYQTGLSISSLVKQLVDTRVAEYQQELSQFRAGYNKHVTEALASQAHFYNQYLQNISNSDWMSFARLLFNNTHRAHRGRSQQPGDAEDSLFSLDMVSTEFGKFMEIEEVEEIEPWSRRFFQM